MGLPVSETYPAEVKVTLGALDVIAAIRLWNDEMAIRALTRVGHEPRNVVLVAFSAARCRHLFTPGEPLLPVRACQGGVGLGRPAVPAEEVKFSAINAARNWRRSFQAFFPTVFIILCHLDDTLAVGVGTLPHQATVQLVLERILFEFQVLPGDTR